MGFEVKEGGGDPIPHEVSFNFKGHDIHLTVDIAALNPELDKWAASYVGRRSTLRWLEKVVIDWDITNDGVPIPITAEAMEQYNLPEPLTNMMWNEIRDATSVPNLRRASSGGKSAA